MPHIDQHYFLQHPTMSHRLRIGSPRVFYMFRVLRWRDQGNEAVDQCARAIWRDAVPTFGELGNDIGVQYAAVRLKLSAIHETRAVGLFENLWRWKANENVFYHPTRSLWRRGMPPCICTDYYRIVQHASLPRGLCYQRSLS